MTHHEKVVVDLEYPINVDGVEVTSLSLRRANVMDIELTQNTKDNDLTKSIKMIANLSGMAPDHIRLLDAADFGKVSSKVMDFFGDSLQEA